MGTKEEWEEIEKSYTKRGEEIKKQYGFDILQVDKDSEETKKKIATANKKLEKFFKIVGAIAAIGAGVAGGLCLYSKLKHKNDVIDDVDDYDDDFSEEEDEEAEKEAEA